MLPYHHLNPRRRTTKAPRPPAPVRCPVCADTDAQVQRAQQGQEEPANRTHYRPGVDGRPLWGAHAPRYAVLSAPEGFPPCADGRILLEIRKC
jgi:hypothetical protein